MPITGIIGMALFLGAQEADMCYSAKIAADLRWLEREYGATLSLPLFAELFRHLKAGSGWQKVPKTMRASFQAPRNDLEREIAGLIGEGQRAQTSFFETELFKQRSRLASAERSLAVKATKKAESDKRIAIEKIAAAQRNLVDLQRVEQMDSDSRIFPGYYAPVIVANNGQRTIVPMRYRCRLPGWTEAMERQKPGTYNARMDNLERAWGKLFGVQHGVLVANAFFENVTRHRMEHRELAAGEKEQNVVLEFQPEPRRPMLLACLWSFSKSEGEDPDLYSFAAITDDPPAEVAAAGHDRCIVPIKSERLDAWLNPKPGDLAEPYAILADRARLFYEHRLAAA